MRDFPKEGVPGTGIATPTFTNLKNNQSLAMVAGTPFLLTVDKFHATHEDQPKWRFLDYSSTTTDLLDGFSGMAACVTDNPSSNAIILHTGCSSANAKKGYAMQVLGWPSEPGGVDGLIHLVLHSRRNYPKLYSLNPKPQTPKP